jgi:hypothetical protein
VTMLATNQGLEHGHGAWRNIGTHTHIQHNHMAWSSEHSFHPPLEVGRREGSAQASLHMRRNHTQHARPPQVRELVLTKSAEAHGARGGLQMVHQMYIER